MEDWRISFRHRHQDCAHSRAWSWAQVSDIPKYFVPQQKIKIFSSDFQNIFKQILLPLKIAQAQAGNIPRYFPQTQQIKIFWIFFELSEWHVDGHHLTQQSIPTFEGWAFCVALADWVVDKPCLQESLKTGSRIGLRRIPSQIAPQCYSQHNPAFPAKLCSSSCKMYLSQTPNVFASIA